MIQPRNILLTGIPRSGTSLVCQLLGKLPNTLALQEPMDVRAFGEMKDFEEIKNTIDTFFEEMRKSALENGLVISHHVEGNLPDNYFPPPDSSQGIREGLAQRGYLSINKTVTVEMIMIIKHPIAFTALIPEILQHYVMFTTIRNPLWSLASWNSTKIPSRKGHAPVAEALDKRLASELDVIPDQIDRQIYLLNWMFEKYLKMPIETIIRYEDIITSSGKCLQKILPEAQQINADLASENRPDRYPNAPLEELRSRLLKKGGAFLEFYPKSTF